MLVPILKAIGWVAAHLPEKILQGTAELVGGAIYYGHPRRRRLLRSNLHHAFPARPAAWHRRLARESCVRLVETGFLSAAIPFLKESRVRELIQAGASAVPWLKATSAAQQAQVAMTPHFAYWEFETAIPLLYSGTPAEFGIIFRPLDHPGADAWVQKTRERFGMKLLSRKKGFSEAIRILRRSGCVGILFDQNAGMQGSLTTLFGRVCSTAELPGLLVERASAEAWIIFIRRTAFWRATVEAEKLEPADISCEVTIAGNRWLEKRLAENDDLCASWLWLHDRWRNQDVPARRFHLEAKRTLLAEECAQRGWSEIPRRTRFYLRLSNWLGDVIMSIPLLLALRKSRPDAEITLLAQARYVPWLQSLDLAEHVVALPSRGRGYFSAFWKMRRDYPDTWVLFTNSFRGDLESWLANAPQRFGIVFPGRWRPLLTHRYAAPTPVRAGGGHQSELWENFFRDFGLQGGLDRSPRISGGDQITKNVIGLIAGSENFPAKRWPVARWRELIAAFPDRRFRIFGTQNDTALAAAIGHGFPADRIDDRTGKTDLLTFAEELSACVLVVTNDTGGMHLANFRGIPVVALFGPTNPVRTGPIFEAPVRILQPPGCAAAGGGDLSHLTAAQVDAAVRDLLGNPLDAL